MEEKKMALTDSLVKAVAWTHNTSINKLGYNPLQLVTSKSVTLPGLTIGNEGTESMTDCKAVQTLETLNKITKEFCKAEMRKKLNECQDTRVQTY